MMSTNCTL